MDDGRDRRLSDRLLPELRASSLALLRQCGLAAAQCRWSLVPSRYYRPNMVSTGSLAKVTLQPFSDIDTSQGFHGCRELSQDAAHVLRESAACCAVLAGYENHLQICTRRRVSGSDSARYKAHRNYGSTIAKNCLDFFNDWIACGIPWRSKFRHN